MELNTVEKDVLASFSDGEMMTLKMIATKMQKMNQNTSRQSVWYALQLLVARDLVKKVDRGVYKRA